MRGEWTLEKQQRSDLTALVASRGWVWTRVGGVTHGDVRRVRVTPCAMGAPDLDTLLEPFDRVEAIGRLRRAHKVSTAWLRRWVAAWPSVAWPALPLTAPIDLPIALLPHQLSPALAVIRGASSRLLLADAVGQGKTIEAGLLLRELAARGAADRVLILTPLTLRDQWRAELGLRCGLEAEVIDRASLRARDRQTASGVNAFQAPGIFLLSTDLAKQPDVLARLVHVCWDALVVDEAHGLSGDSARAAAAAALGARARLVLLLSATPHAGDAEAFARICAIGRVDGEPPLLWFRHCPSRNGRNGSPKNCDISPARSAEEGECLAALGRYVRRLDQTATPESRLIALVLRKRALSSPAALTSSLRHRMAWLDRHDAPAEQPGLPFDAEETERSDDEQPELLRQPGLADARVEAALLAAAFKAAQSAAAHWSKLRSLRRLLKRTCDRVVVFTEYRDTLLALSAALSAEFPVAVLHGGLSRTERGSALGQFASGQARVLIATDVAAEGLNLQHTCRLVVHVELPWSPARLEQRNGRVDRLGQMRRVHVWRLLGDPLHESRVVAALASRLARMRAAGIDVGTLSVPSAVVAHEPANSVDDTGDHGIVHATSDDDAERVAEDLARLRRLVAACSRSCQPSATSMTRSALAWRRVRPCRDGLPRGATIVCLLQGATRGTRPVLLPVHVALSGRPPGPPSRWLPVVAEAAVTAAAGQHAGVVDALRRREHALLARAREEQARTTGRWQGSLFERRTARIVEAARADAAARIDEHQQRLAELREGTGAPAAVAVLALLVD